MTNSRAVTKSNAGVVAAIDPATGLAIAPPRAVMVAAFGRVLAIGGGAALGDGEMDQHIRTFAEIVGAHPEPVLREAIKLLELRCTFRPKTAELANAILDAYLALRHPLTADGVALAKRMDDPAVRPTKLVPDKNGRPRIVASAKLWNDHGNILAGQALNVVVGTVPFADGEMALKALDRERLRLPKGTGIDDVAEEIRTTLVIIARDAVAPLPEGEMVTPYVALTRDFAARWPQFERAEIVEALKKSAPTPSAPRWFTHLSVARYGRGLQIVVEAEAASILAGKVAEASAGIRAIREAIGAEMLAQIEGGTVPPFPQWVAAEGRLLHGDRGSYSSCIPAVAQYATDRSYRELPECPANEYLAEERWHDWPSGQSIDRWLAVLRTWERLVGGMPKLGQPSKATQVAA